MTSVAGFIPMDSATLDDIGGPILRLYNSRNRPTYNEALKLLSSMAIWFESTMTRTAAPIGEHEKQ